MHICLAHAPVTASYSGALHFFVIDENEARVTGHECEARGTMGRRKPPSLLPLHAHFLGNKSDVRDLWVRKTTINS